jgi:hypothetical protein
MLTVYYESALCKDIDGVDGLCDAKRYMKCLRAVECNPVLRVHYDGRSDHEWTNNIQRRKQQERARKQTLT